MALQVKSFDQHVATRLLDFFGNRTPWTRRLWSAGTPLMLRELIEVADTDQGTLTEASARWLANAAKRRVGPDLGARAGRAHKIVEGILDAKEWHHAKGHDYH